MHGTRYMMITVMWHRNYGVFLSPQQECCTFIIQYVYLFGWVLEQFGLTVGIYTNILSHEYCGELCGCHLTPWCWGKQKGGTQWGRLLVLKTISFLIYHPTPSQLAPPFLSEVDKDNDEEVGEMKKEKRLWVSGKCGILFLSFYTLPYANNSELGNKSLEYL